MSPGEARAGTAGAGRPHPTRPVAYEPVPPIHDPCLTDLELGSCPEECPPETRQETR